MASPGAGGRQSEFLASQRPGTAARSPPRSAGIGHALSTARRAIAKSGAGGLGTKGQGTVEVIKASEMALCALSLALTRGTKPRRSGPGLASPFLAKVVQMFDEDVRLFDEPFNNRTEVVGSTLFINLQKFVNSVDEGAYLMCIKLSRGLHGLEFH